MDFHTCSMAFHGSQWYPRVSLISSKIPWNFDDSQWISIENIDFSKEDVKEVIEKLTLMVKEFTENEIPKYSNLLVETKIKSEEEVKELEKNVL